MSQQFYGSYKTYISSKNCCKDLLPGPVGPTGPAGPLPTPTSGSTGNTVTYVGGTWYVSPSKTFIIDHPNDANKYLVHACLEGPESGVYYRGKSEIINGESVVINLPDYVKDLARDFTVSVTGIYDGKLKLYNTSEVNEDGYFTVYGENGMFHWSVIGKRSDIVVEPFKNEINIRGDGPYKYIDN